MEGRRDQVRAPSEIALNHYLQKCTTERCSKTTKPTACESNLRCRTAGRCRLYVFADSDPSDTVEATARRSGDRIPSHRIRDNENRPDPRPATVIGLLALNLAVFAVQLVQKTGSFVHEDMKVIKPIPGSRQ